MPFLHPKDRKAGDGEWVYHFPPFGGNEFDIPGIWMGANQLKALIGAGTDNNGHSLRPLPGRRPLGPAYSLRHPGITAASRTPLTGLSVWIFEDRPGDQPVVVVFNHDAYNPATANPSRYPNEIVRLRGVSLSDAPRIYRPHAPLVGRDELGRFETNTLLNPALYACIVEYQPSPRAPNIVVIAADNNWARAVSATQDEPGVELRKFGLNTPIQAVGTVEPIDVASVSPVGPQLYLRKGGTTEWTKDPDHDFELVNGEYLEVDISRVWGPVVDNVRQESYIHVAVLEGDVSSTSLNFRGTVHDPVTGAQSEVAGASDAVTVSALTTSADSQGTTVHQALYGKPSTNYVSANQYRYDEFNSSTIKYPRIYFNVATGSPAPEVNRVVAFRGGRKINLDDEPTQWKVGYCWERRFGDYLTRGGHSSGADEFPVTIPAGHNMRCRGFGKPLTTEFPTDLSIVTKKQTADVFEASTQGIASKAFYVARTVPVRRATRTTVTITGISHDGTTVTVTVSGGHGFVTHDLIFISGVTGTGVANINTQTDYRERITKTSDTTFTYVPSSGGAPAGTSLTGGTAIRSADYEVTDTGYPQHDMNIDRIVVDCWLDEGDVFEGQDIVPGGCTSLGGTYSAVAHQGRIFSWGLTRTSFSALTMTQGSKTITSEVDTFRGYQVGRALNIQGEPYYISRVVREVKVNVDPAELEVTRRWDGEDTTETGFLVPRLNVLYWTFSDPPYAEQSHVNNEAVLPDAADVIMDCVPDGSDLIVFCRRATYRFVTFPEIENISTENVTPMGYEWRLVNTDHGAASPNSVSRVDGSHVVFTGRGVSMGFNPENLTDITYEKNSRMFRGELYDTKSTGWADTGYDQRSRRFKIANLKSVAETFAGIPEWAIDIDMSAAGNPVSLSYPDLTRAIGEARTTLVPYAEESRIRCTLVVMYADVATVGSGGAASRTGPHVVVHDVYANTTQAIYVGTGTDLDYAIIDNETDAPSGSRCTLQRCNGKLVCQLSDYIAVELTRATDGTWSVTDFKDGVGFTQANFLAFASSLRGNKLYGLSYEYGGNSGNPAVLTEFGSSTIRIPYIEGVGGRQLALTGDAFVGTNVFQSILTGPGGEIILLGYDTDTIVVKRIDPFNMDVLFTDQVFTATDITAIKGAVVNRHGDIFVVWDDDTNHFLSRIQLPDSGINGFDGLITTLATTTPTSDRTALCLDSRQQAWFFYGTTDSGERRIAVQRFAESNTSLDSPAYVLYRSGYHRDLVSFVQAHHYNYYIVRDENTGDSSDVEYKMLRAIGDTERTETFLDGSTFTFYTGDGTPYIASLTGGTEDDASVSTDLVQLIAGTGGALDYLRLDDQYLGGRPVPCQAVPTTILSHRGLVSS